MLRSIRIQNYALIENLEVGLKSGFSAITGETGAGKSIMLEALSLVLGARANYNSIRYGEDKCVVELEAEYQSQRINDLLKSWELDLLDVLILRRELSSSKRSRAFINDTPVTLQQLTEIGRHLVDLHGQQENIALQTANYQIQQLDRFAGHRDLLEEYRTKYKTWKGFVKKRDELSAQIDQLRKDRDYFEFQFNELDEAKLNKEEYESLEDNLNQLEHAEEIAEALTGASALLESDEVGVLSQLRNLESQLRDVSRFAENLRELKERVSSASIELNDVLKEIEDAQQNLEVNPEQLDFLRERMDIYNKLMHKHGLADFSELLALRDEFEEKLKQVEHIDDDLSSLEKEVEQAFKMVQKSGAELSKSRSEAAKNFSELLTERIHSLGMPKGAIQIQLTPKEEPASDGLDRVEFRFNANAKDHLVPISEVASGGEISRVMLAIKSLLKDSNEDFTVVFDEIDTGVSGEVASKIGLLMKSIGQQSQVLAVTHLPGVAAKADSHLKMFKSEQNGKVSSSAQYIEGEQRVEELASMFSGDSKSDAALESARSMLKA